jgi:hypothetical protein
VIRAGGGGGGGGGGDKYFRYFQSAVSSCVFCDT